MRQLSILASSVLFGVVVAGWSSAFVCIRLLPCLQMLSLCNDGIRAHASTSLHPRPGETTATHSLRAILHHCAYLDLCAATLLFMWLCRRCSPLTIVLGRLMHATVADNPGIRCPVYLPGRRDARLRTAPVAPVHPGHLLRRVRCCPLSHVGHF